MTPLEVITAARQVYNSVSDNFFSDSELYTYLYQACSILAQRAQLIENVYTTTTTASTQEYSWPTYVISIKRITYNGIKLQPITFREDDMLTLGNQSNTSTGTPAYYAMFNRTLYLRPIPDSSSGTLKIFAYANPQTVSVSSTLEIPELFHHQTIDYIVHRMAMKDGNANASNLHADLWKDTILEAIKWKRKYKYSDGFPRVVNTESGMYSFLGKV